jgi:predicted permease
MRPRALLQRIRNLVRNHAWERDVDDELRFHIDQEAAELERRGLPPDESRRRALAAFGGVARHKETAREQRSIAWLEDLRRDGRFALRQMGRAPGYCAVVALTLALGIGVNAAIFSLVRGVLLRPLPFAEPGQLLSVREIGYLGEMLALRERVRSFEVAAYLEAGGMSLTGNGEAVRLETARVSPNLFPLLGVRPLLGRVFSSAEERPGNDAVAILSHAEWVQRFGRDPGVIGRRLTIEGVPRTIVGIMPPELRFPSRETQLWIPMSFDGANRVALWSTGARIVARLRDGATRERASAELQAMLPQLRASFPWTMPADYAANAALVPLHEELVGSVRPLLVVLMAAAGLVLLVAAANVANLMLARAAGREREMAVRAVLGAGRRRLVRQLMTESLILAIVGGVIGLALARWSVAGLLLLLGHDLPRVDEIHVDGAVLLFALAITLGLGALCGALPAVRIASRGSQPLLRDGGRVGTGVAHRRVARVLGIAEIGLAAVLITGAGFLVKSFWRILQVDPGFRAEHLVVATVAPPAFRYETGASRREFARTLVERLESVRGVRGVSIASAVPLGPDVYGSVFIIEGRPDPVTTGTWPWANARLTIGTDLLRVLEARVIEGRAFDATDGATAPGVVLVSSALARRFWPEGHVVGARIRFPADTVWRTVVGIVDDVRWTTMVGLPDLALYLPFEQAGAKTFRVVARTSGDSMVLSANLRAIVADLDRDAPVSDVHEMEAMVDASVTAPRAAAALLSLFGALSLVLGVIGIYGIFAYAASRRVQEMGVRVALGATRRDVVGLLLAEGARLTAIGVLVGIAAALIAARLARHLLFEVQPADPVVIIAAVLLLGSFALLATYLPARRAARVDPMVALRGE